MPSPETDMLAFYFCVAAFFGCVAVGMWFGIARRNADAAAGLFMCAAIAFGCAFVAITDADRVAQGLSAIR